MLNSVVFMGRLTADPELRTTPNGVSVTTFTIAVDRPFQRGSANGDRSERIADFFDVVAWRSQAEFVTKFFHKGSMICVQGYMTTRTYTDRNNVNRKAYELVAENVHFTGERRGDAPAAVPSAPSASVSAPAASYSSGDKGDFAEISGDDDLPF